MIASYTDIAVVSMLLGHAQCAITRNGYERLVGVVGSDAVMVPLA
jgi:hypothetical protein